jgi:formate hydrogenlyase subunit 6/NADH:ubiquinone oxidoreductase subunit I/flavodoxin
MQPPTSFLSNHEVSLNVVIYYFSGTGNSLTVARAIAKKLNGKLAPIPFAMESKKTRVEADVVGIVFPVYYAINDCGIPLIVNRFLEGLENLGSKYVFAVCTHGGMPGSTIGNLKKAIEAHGSKLACGFIIKMRNTNLSTTKQQKQHVDMENKVETISAYVSARKEGTFETRGLFRKIVLTPLFLFEKLVFTYRYRKLSGGAHLPFKKLVPFADTSYRVNEKCTGCGICTKICPVNNIKMIEDKPAWQHQCETCYACYTWCPTRAICGDLVAYNDHYHNPKIQLSDMMSAN